MVYITGLDFARFTTVHRSVAGRCGLSCTFTPGTVVATRGSLAAILVLTGTTGAGTVEWYQPVLGSARLKRVQGHSSAVNMA